jgi:hypothetical protein
MIAPGHLLFILKDDFTRKPDFQPLAGADLRYKTQFLSPVDRLGPAFYIQFFEEVFSMGLNRA